MTTEPTRSAEDFSITDGNGNVYPMILARDENGQRQWVEGFAPMLAPMVRTTSFGYENVPPDVAVTESVEGFAGGCGFIYADPARNFNNGIGFVGMNVPRYNYARGIDASYITAAFVQLENRSTSAILSAPTKIVPTSLGLFALCGPRIYKWSLPTMFWVLADDASSDGGGDYVDMAEMNGVIYAARGAATDYKYTNDGVLWTSFTAADENADAFAVRGNGSDIAGLWKVQTNIIKVAVDGTNAGTWIGGDEVGHTSETMRSMISVNNELLIWKREGLYTYDGTNTFDTWKTQYFDSENGKHAFLWVNGKVYVVYGRRVLQYDDFLTTTNPIETVFPTAGMDSLEILGLPTAIGGDDNHLYIAVQNKDGNTYILQGDDHQPATSSNPTGWTWHVKAFLGANACQAITAVSPGVMHPTNPVLVFGQGTAIQYMVLPQQDKFPDEDPNCTFQHTEGQLYGAYVDFGVKTYNKFLAEGAMLARNLSADHYADLRFDQDYDTTVTTLVHATRGTLTEVSELNEFSFFILRPILAMNSGASGVTPHVDAFSIGATLNPPRKQLWAPVVILSDLTPLADGTNIDSILPSAAEMRKRLRSWIRQRITLTDIDGIEHIARLLDMQQQKMTLGDIGDYGLEASAFQLSIVEIAAIPSGTPAVYGQSSYGDGHVYGSGAENLT